VDPSEVIEAGDVRESLRTLCAHATRPYEPWGSDTRQAWTDKRPHQPQANVEVKQTGQRHPATRSAALNDDWQPLGVNTPSMLGQLGKPSRSIGGRSIPPDMGVARLVGRKRNILKIGA